MSAEQVLRLEYVTPSESLLDEEQGVLGAAAFANGARTLSGGGVEFPLAHVHTPVLGDAREMLEVWRAGGRAQPGSHGRVRYAWGGDFLFGSLAVHEAELASVAGSAPATALEMATDLAYRQMYAALAAAGNPQLVRVWNYIPDINRDTHGLERYRQFNKARHEATLACGRVVTGTVPAASALGAAAGSPLTMYFLASRRTPAFIENPRQVSAYRYPMQYGPRSPAFSRATVLGEARDAMLFVSGTASIVGHQTLHAGDPAAQTRETLANIEALLDEAARRTGTGKLRLETLAYKVYVRDPKDLPAIRTQLAAALGAEAAVLYLQADICRRDLAVEIEAVGGLAA
ncbi:MAG TPA: Rid family hydrolase [Steroidobacteraceae bacterium]|nr:Rid family hydrolase [Steroidobacteraceae bacterium]